MASVTELPSGSWRVQIRRKGHKPINETFSTERLANAFAKKKEAQLEQIKATGGIKPEKGLTLADCIDDYLANSRELQRSAMAIYKRLKATIGSVNLMDVNYEFLTIFAEERMVGKSTGVTVAGDLSLITSVLKYCKKKRKLDIDSYTADRVRKELGEDHKIKSAEIELIPTEDELGKILRYFDNDRPCIIDMPPLIRFAVATGMRQEEICRILIEDINKNPESPSVLIRERKHPKEKLSRNERVPLLPEAWVIAQQAIGGRQSGCLFPYNSRSVGAAYRRARVGVGVTSGTRFHDLRHLAVTNFFAIGLSVPQVAVMSGHRDWQTLKRYRHIKAKDVQRAYRELKMKEKSSKAVIEGMAWVVEEVKRLRGELAKLERAN
ncbi:MAG: tyrosine-type recombinase/integrase [Pseudomonas sp.]